MENFAFHFFPKDLSDESNKQQTGYNLGTMNKLVNWIDRDFRDKRGAETMIEAATFQDTYNILKKQAKARERIPYSELMTELKKNNHRRISRKTIGSIVGEVSDQISLRTKPSVYPSSIVVLKGTNITGKGFWDLGEGTLPPNAVQVTLRGKALDQYQKDVFNKDW